MFRNAPRKATARPDAVPKEIGHSNCNGDRLLEIVIGLGHIRGGPPSSPCKTRLGGVRVSAGQHPGDVGHEICCAIKIRNISHRLI